MDTPASSAPLLAAEAASDAGGGGGGGSRRGSDDESLISSSSEEPMRCAAAAAAAARPAMMTRAAVTSAVTGTNVLGGSAGVWPYHPPLMTRCNAEIVSLVLCMPDLMPAPPVAYNYKKGVQPTPASVNPVKDGTQVMDGEDPVDDAELADPAESIEYEPLATAHAHAGTAEEGAC